MRALVYSSIGFVTLMTIERYLAICKPMYHRVINTKGRCFKLVISTWAIAGVYAISIIPYTSYVFKVCNLWAYDDDEFPVVATFCQPTAYARRARYVAIFHFVIQPVPIMLAMLSSMFCYIRIIIQLSRRTVTSSNTKQQTGGSGAITPSASVIKTRNDIAKMLVVNGTVFFLLSFPVLLPGTIDSVQRIRGNVLLSYHQLKQMLWVGRCLIYLNSSINPIIVNIMSPRYGSAFRQALGCSR